jgi:pimeloyl-ACP methyl ester carboxylesterase
MDKTIIVQGKNLFYRDQGEGMPVVLVHGFAEDGAVWEDVAPAYRICPAAAVRLFPRVRSRWSHWLRCWRCCWMRRGSTGASLSGTVWEDILPLPLPNGTRSGFRLLGYSILRLLPTMKRKKRAGAKASNLSVSMA